ncbi:MAG: glycosyltransferase family 2 protein [Acidobacteriaceae bacterium]|nr:glycosyltransferase family 2 protein [Acidobacteriaceae bacterium]
MDEITLRIIVNCGPSEDYVDRCLDSVRSQSFVNWQAYVTVDPCGDRTLQEALRSRKGDHRIHIHQNSKRQYSMLNLVQAVGRSSAQREDVFVVLDGDDWFATPDALRIIHDTYKQFNCWMTYGSWVSDQPNMQGMWPAYPEGTIHFRHCEWLGTAVRTWKRWLWDLIDDRDFRDAKGKYFRVTEDQAAMLPMLEMSGTGKARHIPETLMVYNRSSPHACCYTCRDEMLANAEYLRALPPYSQLVEKPHFGIATGSLRLQRG